MNIQPSIFHFNSHSVRVVERGGLVWFVASDVSDALEYRSAKDLARNLDDDEKGRHIVPTLGGDQAVTIINESGLYHAILKSRKPAAKAFRRWVTAEVLPALRKGDPVPGLPKHGHGLPVGQRYLLRAGDDQLVPVADDAVVVLPSSEAALAGLVGALTTEQKKTLLTLCAANLCKLQAMPANRPVLMHWAADGQLEFRMLLGQRVMETQALHGSLNVLDLLREHLRDARACADLITENLEEWEVRNGGISA